MNEDKNNKKISRFANILYAPDLPALYNQGLTDYEILVRLAAVINNNADIMTDYSKVIDELVKILGDVDEVIKQKVIAAIEYMYNSGELAEIIGEIIANSITGKFGTLDLSHMAYVLHRAHSYGTNVLPTSVQDYSQLTINEELFHMAQGNCVFQIAGNFYWAVCYVCSNGGSYDQQLPTGSNSAAIYIYTINGDGSMNYVTHKEFAILGHCNSMTYLNGYLYIAPNSYVGSNGGTTTDVHRISFNGETLGGDWEPSSQTYRAETKTPTGWIYDTTFSDHICAFRDKLYLCDSVMNLYSYDWDTNTVTLEIERLNGLAGYTGDGFAMDDNFIYMGAQQYKIKRYNRALGTVDWVYKLPIKCNNNSYKLGEVEGFTVLDGVIYVLGCYNLAGVSKAFNTYTVTRFYRQNLSTNNIDDTHSYNWSNGYVMRQQTFFVDGALPADTDNPTNNIGTSQATAFRCIQIALDYIESNDWINRALIKVSQYRNLSTIDIRTGKPITISGSDYYNSNNVRPSIGQISIMPNSYVSLQYLGFNNVLPSNIGDSNALSSCVFAIGSYLELENNVFPTGLVTNQINCRYAMNLPRCYANVRIITADADTSETAWNTYRTNNGVTNPIFVNTYNSSINGHGKIEFRGRSGNILPYFTDSEIDAIRAL